MKKLFAILLCALTLVACDDKDGGEGPGGEIFPITGLELPDASGVIPGETATILGKGFNSTSEIWFLSENSRLAIPPKQAEIKTEIISYNSEGIQFIVPKVYGKQSIQLRQDGKYYLLGALNMAEKKSVIYGLKRDWSGIDYLRQIMSIDPAFGKPTLVANVMNIDNDYEDLIFYPATNEILGYFYSNFGSSSYSTVLLKVNVETGSNTTFTLEDGHYSEMVATSAGKVYAHMRIEKEGSNPIDYDHIITEINPLTGQQKKIVTLNLEEDIDYINDPVYNETTGEFIGNIWVYDNGIHIYLIKINLFTGKHTLVKLEDEYFYDGMSLIDGKLYSIKEPSEGRQKTLVAIDPNDGKETKVAQFSTDIEHVESMQYNKSTGDLIFLVGMKESNNSAPQFLATVDLQTGKISLTDLGVNQYESDYSYVIVAN